MKKFVLLLFLACAAALRAQIYLEADGALLGNGTAGAPTFSFSSDPDTGMYRSASDELSFAAGGTRRFFIGTTSAATTTPLFSIQNSGDIELRLDKVGVRRWSLSNTGNLAVVTGDGAGTFTFGNSGGVLFPDGTAGAPALAFAADPDTGIYRSGTNRAVLAAGGSDVLVWNATSLQGGDQTTGAFLIPRAAGSASAPTYSFNGDNTTGIYREAAGVLGVTSGGTRSLRLGPGGALYGSTVDNYLQLGPSGGVGIVAAGTNQNITLTPSGTGFVSVAGNLSLRRDSSGHAALTANNQTTTGTATLWLTEDNVSTQYFQLARYGSTHASKARVTEFSVNGGGNFAFVNGNVVLGATADDGTNRLQVTGTVALSPGSSSGIVLNRLATNFNLRSVDDSENPEFNIQDSRLNASAFKVSARTATVTIAGTAAVRGIRTATTTLDFPSVAAQSSEVSSSITVTGAAVGDAVTVSPPPAAVVSGVHYSAHISAANTVLIRAHNYTGSAIDPASGSFRVTVTSF